MKIDINLFPHFFAQNSQFNRKTFFDVNKIGYFDSSGREKLLQTYEFLVRHYPKPVPVEPAI